MCIEGFSMCLIDMCVFVLFKQKTAYEMRISDWSSDVCSSDLHEMNQGHGLLISSLISQCWDMENVAQQYKEFSATFSPMLEAVNPHTRPSQEIGRASCRERVCQYGQIPVVAFTLKQKTKFFSIHH